MAFIVLEGLDGAGKSTQVKMLQDLLSSKGLKYEYLHFPRFDSPVYGDLVARFLRGELGGLDEVNPYLVALIYAGDRQNAASMIRGWLAQGKVVIVDRYVYSNIGYQCAKVADSGKRKELRDWILNLEYDYNKIPKPDVSIFLDVPFCFTEKKLTESREGDDRGYLKGKKDIHEASLAFQQRVREVYLDQAVSDKNLKVISCADESGNMPSPDAIFAMIKEALKGFI